jgi:ubiquinone/menaquinone biosynthesis C-methylase UbiE
MLSGSEKYYDDIYETMGKDYVAEANKIHELIQKYHRTDGNTLLDVACGTGTHAGLLSEWYNVEGTDLNANMLRVARKKHPGIQFTRSDMRSFYLGRKFDVVTCLFSAIGYMKTRTELQKAIKSMSHHLLAGGVLLVEPWFTKEEWNRGRVSTILVNKPDLKIVRMTRGGIRGNISLLDFQYLVGTSKGIKHIVEHHEFGLFSEADYRDAFAKAGLPVIHDSEGVDGRGLYIGIKQQNKQ